jgi:multicomponent Na+:H+ antiporter subunit D
MVAVFEEGYVVIAALLLMGSLLAVAYVWRVVEVAYFRPPTSAVAAATEAPLVMLIPTYVVIGASIGFGIWTTFPTGMARQAAVAIMGAN